LDATFSLDLDRLQLSPHDVERRKAFVDLQPEDVARIRSIQDIFLPNADRYIAAFFGHLAGIEEATKLSGNHTALEEAKRLEHEHLIAMMQGDYGGDYMEQRVKLGMLYSRAGLDVRILLGAFHVMWRALGAEVMSHFAKEPAKGFDAFISVKKIGFLDIGLIVDVLIAERERVISVQQDAIKRTEELLVQAQKMEMVGQLSGGIAHDFNNLLTVIIGNAEFLSEKLQTRQDLQQLADDIGRAGDRGAELTQRLLAFGRRQVLRPVEIDCNALLDSMHKLLQRTLRQDIQIKTDFAPELFSAFADAAQLESAVLNLAVNAQDAMLSGGRLTISTANASLDGHYKSLHAEVIPGEYVLIAVTDDGEGMPKEVIERAFEPFYTTKEVGKGSGLGLSMVYGFVKQSNGHVAIYSEPGLGTTVRIYLPQMVSKLPLAPKQTQASSGSLPPGTETVLVVEDDPFVRSYSISRVESLGYSVIAAVDGNDALQKLRSDIPVDILFTDIVMPGGINGWELADLARKVRPGLPVLLTSGYALETLVKHGRLRAGAVVLTKPYRKDDLARRLREVVSVSGLLSKSTAQAPAAPTGAPKIC
jgi:signal transduction histidine kinase/ActR/RegA family two-component response regulator